VATLGTALSDDHVRELRRFAEHIYLVFDADSAGVNAALRGQAMFRAAGTEVRIVRLPGGHDPDTLIREQGTDAFEACLKGALAPTAFELERLVAQFPARDTETRLRLFRAAAGVLQPLPRLERAEYAEWLIDRWLGGPHGDTAMLQQAILSEVAMLDRRPRRPTPTPRPVPTPRSDDPEGLEPEPDAIPEPPPAEVPLERAVLAAMIQYPDFARSILQEFPSKAFSNRNYRSVYHCFQEMSEQGVELDARALVTEDDIIASTLAALALYELQETEKDLDKLFEHMKDEYEKRFLLPPTDPFSEREATYAFIEKHRERSRRFGKKYGYDS